MPKLTPLTSLCYALELDAPLGRWSDGAQAAETIRTLATLLDGVLADDRDAIRAAVAWLADNVDGVDAVDGDDGVGGGEG